MEQERHRGLIEIATRDETAIFIKEHVDGAGEGSNWAAVDAVVLGAPRDLGGTCARIATALGVQVTMGTPAEFDLATRVEQTVTGLSQNGKALADPTFREQLRTWISEGAPRAKTELAQAKRNVGLWLESVAGDVLARMSTAVWEGALINGDDVDALAVLPQATLLLVSCKDTDVKRREVDVLVGDIGRLTDATRANPQAVLVTTRMPAANVLEMLESRAVALVVGEAPADVAAQLQRVADQHLRAIAVGYSETLDHNRERVPRLTQFGRIESA